MLDEKFIARALQDATKPLTDGLKELGGKFDEHRMAMVESVAEIKTDIKYLKAGQDDAADCEAKKNWPLVDQLLRRDEITSSIKLSKPSITAEVANNNNNNGISRLGALSTWCIRLAPLILTAAIGLIGLGFYMASGNTEDTVATMRQLRALADTTTKMTYELKKIQIDLSDGGVQ